MAAICSDRVPLQEPVDVSGACTDSPSLGRYLGVLVADPGVHFAVSFCGFSNGFHSGMQKHFVSKQ